MLAPVAPVAPRTTSHPMHLRTRRTDKCPIESAATEPVRDHEQRHPGIGDDGHPQRRLAGNGHREERGLHAERERDVHAHGSDRRAAEANRERAAAPARRPSAQRRRFRERRRCRPRPSRCRRPTPPAQGRRSRRRRPCRPVPSCSRNRRTASTFSTGSRPARTSSTPTDSASDLRGAGVIAGQHRRVRDARPAQKIDHVARRLARLVRQHDRANDPRCPSRPAPPSARVPRARRSIGCGRGGIDAALAEATGRSRRARVRRRSSLPLRAHATP